MIESKTDMPITVHSVMQRQPITILNIDTIGDAVDKMTENHVSALPVLDEEGLLLGIVSVSDLLRLMQSAEQTLENQWPMYDNSIWVTEVIRATLGENEVSTAMSGATITARQEDSLQEVARLMLKHQVHHVPIVSQDKRLLGLVSSTDFVRLAAEG